MAGITKWLETLVYVPAEGSLGHSVGGAFLGKRKDHGIAALTINNEIPKEGELGGPFANVIYFIGRQLRDGLGEDGGEIKPEDGAVIGFLNLFYGGNFHFDLLPDVAQGQGRCVCFAIEYGLYPLGQRDEGLYVVFLKSAPFIGGMVGEA